MCRDIAMLGYIAHESSCLTQIDAFWSAMPQGYQPRRTDAVGPCYAFTTENLAAYLPLFNWRFASVLTVSASGDQIINAAVLGAERIDAFDSNLASAVFTELKLAALQELSFAEFANFFLLDDPTDGRRNVKAMGFDVYQSLCARLSHPARRFFDRAYEYFGNDGKTLRSSLLFNNRHDLSFHALTDNLYLRCNSAFEQASTLLAKRIIPWLWTNAKELSQQPSLRSDYDIILLSNIWDYAAVDFSSEPHPFGRFVRDVLLPLQCRLSRNGLMAVAYLHDVEPNGAEGPRPHWIDRAANRRAALDDAGLTQIEVSIPGVNGRCPDLVVIVAASLGAARLLARIAPG